jgi:hypothetical protein
MSQTTAKATITSAMLMTSAFRTVGPCPARPGVLSSFDNLLAALEHYGVTPFAVEGKRAWGRNCSTRWHDLKIAGLRRDAPTDVRAD